LAVCDVLSPVRELEFLYSSGTTADSPKLDKKNEKQLRSHQGKEPLHFLYLPKSRSSREVSSKIPTPGEISASIEGLKEKSSGPPFAEDVIENPEFQFGLSLLQANILVLCIKAGVDPQTLYPPEALILNLDLLQQKTIEYLSTHEGSAATTTLAEDHINVPSSLPSSLRRLIDPYPSHDTELQQQQQQQDEDDGVYVSRDSSVDYELFDHLPTLPLEDSRKSLSDDRVLLSSSPMREYQEKVESDGQEWAFIEEAEEIENYYR
jgi:hypothetical protein